MSDAAPVEALESGPSRLGAFASRLQSGVARLAQSLDAAELRQSVSASVKAAASTAADKAGAAAAAAKAKAGVAAERVSASVESGAKAAAAGISSGATAIRETAASGVASIQALNADRIIYFVCFSSFAALLIFLAVLVGLPSAPLAPAKFALPFTLGSLCNLCAMGALRGPRGQILHMISSERMYVSTAYVGSMLITLWACLAMHSYILTMLASACQLTALLYYTLSYFPGGIAGFRMLRAAASRTVGPALSACWTATQAFWSDGAERNAMLALLPI